MGSMQRTKGQAGEREIAALLADLTGFDVRRRVRQHDGDSDLEGIPGWSLEVKRHARATPGLIRQWWDQAVAQAERTGTLPVLAYRQDRGEWRMVWMLAPLLGVQQAAMWTDCAWTIEGTPHAWVAAMREIGAQRALAGLRGAAKRDAGAVCTVESSEQC